MKKLLIALALLIIPTGVAFAENAWATYHWPTGDLNPSVKDRTKSSLYDVSAGVQEWVGLETPIQPVVVSGKGQITVKEASNTFWLGLARIFIDGEGHITKGEVQLNTRLLAGYGPAAADHVLCQEIGHVLGLDHNRTALDTCMNDQATLGSATSPNIHDADTFNVIYGHSDTIPEEDGGGSGGGPPCSKKPDHPNCQPSGRWVTVDVFPIPADD